MLSSGRPDGDSISASVQPARRSSLLHGDIARDRRCRLATISLLGAAFVRWPLAIVANGPRAFFGATDLFIVAGLVHDLLSQRRLHPANIWGGLLIVASQPLRLAIASTDAWLAFARAIAGSS